MARPTAHTGAVGVLPSHTTLDTPSPGSRVIREKFMSQVHTWGDAGLLALLLAADFTWLIADKATNQVALPMSVLWALFITGCAFLERRSAPDELVVAATTALWCVGNGFWTLSDFQEWIEMEKKTQGMDGYDTEYVDEFTYAGIEFSNVDLLNDCAFVCFLVSTCVGVWYYAVGRYSASFLDARVVRGDELVDDCLPDNSLDDDEAPSQNFSALAPSREVSPDEERRALVALGTSSAAVGADAATAPNSFETNSFLGPVFTPNLLNVQSRAEYDSLSHFLWIFKDLVWWVSVENDGYLPGWFLVVMKSVTVVVAFCLITHTVDALLVAKRDATSDSKELIHGSDMEGTADSTGAGDDSHSESDENPLSGVVTKVALLFWVLAMTIWSFGDMFWPDPDLRVGKEVYLFSTKSGKDVEGPESSRWWAAWSMTLGVFTLAAFWATEAARAAGKMQK